MRQNTLMNDSRSQAGSLIFKIPRFSGFLNDNGDGRFTEYLLLKKLEISERLSG